MASRVSSELSKYISTLIGLLRRAALEPALTGSLLLALTRSPPKLRAKLFEYFPALADDRRLVIITRTLSVLCGLGLASRVNSVLSHWALNHWTVRKTGTPWNFSGDEEVAVVTGGSSGFGLLITKGLSKKCKVAVLDVQDPPKELEELSSVRFYRCDVSSNDAIHETAAAIRNDLGNPSILINNAGIGKPHTILEMDEAYVDKIFKVNITSHFTLIKEFLPAMLENKKGHIVELASTASYVSGSPIIDYCATKAGVLALYEGLQGELRYTYENGSSIQTTIVHPTWHSTPLIGFIENELTKRSIYVGAPQRVSDAVVKQVLSGRGNQIFVPESQYVMSFARSYPSWVQETLRGLGQMKHKAAKSIKQ